VRRYSRADHAKMAILLEGWRSGELGTRDVIREECATLEVDEAEALAFTRGFDLDPHFVPFARGVLRGGGAVVVLSEGYGFYVRDQLARAGLAELPWAANRLRFEGGRVFPEFPYTTPECPRCGNCKAAHVRRHRDQGFEVVLVGDGLSDRCGARAADRVIARGELLEWCATAGLRATPFESFADVAAWARAHGAMAGNGAARAARGS
jgi:2-hydroxy-3-keto-5-methylthiopentenyl-1-phosphate phosphatase